MVSDRRLFLAVEIPGAPASKARPVFGKGHARTADRTVEYERRVGELASVAMIQRDKVATAKPLFLAMTFWLPRPKRSALQHPTRPPDLSNLEKAIEDGLQGVAFEDDAQIVEKRSVKAFCAGSSSAGVRVELWEIE